MNKGNRGRRVVQMLMLVVLSSFAGVGEERRELPVGVFDSGIGGFTVLEKLLAHPGFERENFVFLGDQANMPYGRYAAEGKADFLRELVLRDGRFLLNGEGHKPAKIIVIGCNTATAYGLKALQDMPHPADVRVIGVVNAGVEATLDALATETRDYAVAVMATPGTISSGVYERTLRASLKARDVKVGVAIANRGGVGLAEAVENHEPTRDICARTNLVALVEAYRATGERKPIRAFIMGCTHYPFVRDVFTRTFADLKRDPRYAPLLADDILFVDPAVYTAEAAYRSLKADGLLRLQDRQGCGLGAPRVKSFISVGRNGPLTDAVKYGRNIDDADYGTEVQLMNRGNVEPVQLARLQAFIPHVLDEIKWQFPDCAGVFPATVKTVGIVMPASVYDRDRFDCGVAALKRAGYDVRLAPRLRFDARASAVDRARDLVDVWTDPAVDLVLCARGGSLVEQIVPYIDWNRLRTRPEMPFVGFSDITVLDNAFLKERAGRPISGPTLSSFLRATPETKAWLNRAVARAPQPSCRLHALKAGAFSGLPCGGHADRFCIALRMGYAGSCRGKVVFLESEDSISRDRLQENFDYLLSDGRLDGAVGVVFGDIILGSFDRAKAPREIARMKSEFAEKAPCPVYDGFKYGHLADNLAVDFLREVSVDANGVMTWR